MNAYLISIGDELLNGQTINTNASYIAAKLSNAQINVARISIIHDDKKDILNEFNYAFTHYDVVIVTGGLGPTHDDLTKSCISEFFNCEEVLDKDVLSHIEELFSKRNREVTPSNREQALIPKAAVPIKNPTGTAPGLWIEKNKKYFAAIPGVPSEMKYMIDEFIVPKLVEKNTSLTNYYETISLNTTGIPESYLYERLGDINKLIGVNNKLAFLPSQFGVKLRLTVFGKTCEEAKNNLSEIEQKIRAIAGRYIFGKDDDTLEQVVGRLLTDRGLKISVAESCTGGLISHRITNVNGSSSYFERGTVVYSNASKVEILSVNEDTIHQYGAVSLEVARQMAEGIKSTSGSDIGLATSGIMGPTGGSPDKPVGLVYIGLCDDNVCTAKEFKFGDDRLLNKDRTSQAALEMVRRHLLGIPYDS